MLLLGPNISGDSKGIELDMYLEIWAYGRGFVE